MEAYIDESGTHKGSPRTSVAAVLGVHWQWRRFLSRWGTVPFHAKEPKCAPLKPALLDAMQDSGLVGFVSSIKPSDYEAHATPQFRSGLGNPYSLSAFAVAIGISKFCKANGLGRVALVVESGQPNVRYVKEVLEFMQSRERYGIALVTVATKRDSIQLGTADFLAHSCTSDSHWFERIRARCQIFEDDTTPAKITAMSNRIAISLRYLRRNRRQSKAG